MRKPYVGTTFHSSTYDANAVIQGHWKDTFQRIPKLSDAGLEKAGARRLVDRGAADGSDNTIFDDFEKWEDEKFWPSVKACFGGGDDPASDCVPALDLAISTSHESYESPYDVREMLVLKSETPASSSGSMKKHIELQLPAGVNYRAGDYLAVLPKNPRENVQRVVHKFSLPWDGSLYIKSKDTFLPHGTPLGIRKVLGSYVELSQTATRRNIKTLMHHTTDAATTMCLKNAIEGNSSSPSITAKKTSVLDLLEAYPAIDLPFETYLAMLPSLRPRLYSISSSPLMDPRVSTLTYSILNTPSLTNTSQRFRGVATNYLASLRPGDHLLATVQPSTPSFHLPQEPDLSAPLIMLCAGTGIAPFRAFVQERAVLMTQGIEVGPALLYVGYRDEKMDRLYVDDFKTWTQMGAVDVRWACSGPAEKGPAGMYVQDRLWDERGEIRALLDKRARVYVCGSRAVADGVEGVMKKLRMEWQGGCCGVEEAEKWLQDSKGRGTYVADVFD